MLSCGGGRGLITHVQPLTRRGIFSRIRYCSGYIDEAEYDTGGLIFNSRLVEWLKVTITIYTRLQ